MGESRRLRKTSEKWQERAAKYVEVIGLSGFEDAHPRNCLAA
jgi:hypothetical protein